MDSPRTCLVIDARKLEMLMLDGPALRLRMQSQASLLFPLQRLSRVHVIGKVDQGFEAFLHCAEQQIPVAFFTAQGKLRCQLYFPVFENSLLSHWIDYVEFDSEARQQYQDWLSGQRLHVLSLMGCSAGNRETRYQVVREKLHEICNKKLGIRYAQDAMEWLTGMLSVHLSQLIVEQGLCHQGRGKRRLLEDLTPIGELLLLHGLACQAAHKKVQVNGYSMSNLYQHESDQIEYCVRRMLAQLISRLEAII